MLCSAFAHPRAHELVEGPAQGLAAQLRGIRLVSARLRWYVGMQGRLSSTAHMSGGRVSSHATGKEGGHDLEHGIGHWVCVWDTR